MRRNIIFIVALTVFVAAACSKENIENHGQEQLPAGNVRGIEVNAGVPEVTKTAIDGVNVLWAKGDRVGFVADDGSVVSGGSVYTIKDEFDGKASATITVPVKDEAEVTDETAIAFTAYYPYSSVTAADGAPVAEITAEQDGRTGKWGYMSAAFSGTKVDLVKCGLTFRHACAYIDFQFKSTELAGCPVTKVTLTSLDETKLFTGEYVLSAETGALAETASDTRYNQVSVSDPVASLGSEFQGKCAVVAPVDLSGAKVKIDVTYAKDGKALTQTKVIPGSKLAAGQKVTLQLNLDKTGFNVIWFEDATLGQALAEKFGSDGYLTMAQAAAVTDAQMSTFVSGTLTKNARISSFHEFQYFNGVTKTPNFFSNGIKIGKITLPNSVNQISDNSFRATNITEINNTSRITGVGLNAFYEVATLKSIDLPSVTFIGRNSFLKASNLESVGDTRHLLSVGGSAFSGCGKLKSIDLNSVTSIDENAFQYCSILENVDLSSLTRAGNYAFANSGLISVVSLGRLSKVSDYMFRNCVKLGTIYGSLPGTIGVYAFQNCSKLVLSGGQLKTVTTIGNGAFNSCRGIVGEISLPQIKSIGSDAFAFSGITSIDLTGAPITEIGSYAFEKMSALKKITISANVTKFCADIFLCSGNLSEIHLLSTIPAVLETDALKISDNDVYSGIIYVPQGYLETYKNAEGWSTYADRIQEEN